MRFIKTFFGVILCIAAFGFTVATEQVEPSMQPFFILLVGLCILGAVLLFKKTKKEKAKKLAKQPTISEGSLVTVQTDVVPDAVPADIAKEMRKYYNAVQAQRDMEIMADSFRLASTTTNLDTFCMRYELALRKAHTLLQAEQVGVRGLKKLNFHNACVSVIDTAPSLRVRALHDYITDAVSQAEALKTDRGKYNRYTKILKELEKAEPTFMFMDEYDAVIEKVKERITQLETPQK